MLLKCHFFVLNLILADQKFIQSIIYFIYKKSVAGLSSMIFGFVFIQNIGISEKKI